MARGRCRDARGESPGGGGRGGPPRVRERGRRRGGRQRLHGGRFSQGRSDGRGVDGGACAGSRGASSRRPRGRGTGGYRDMGGHGAPTPAGAAPHRRADGRPTAPAAARAEPALRRARRRGGGRRMSGFVSLVGAGPGDPELLTVKAARRLGEADLVLYDALVSPEILDLTSGAQCFSVGKRAGRPSVAQETIHRLMIRGATRGKRVVRLKCGDPFVLGRGGEEALALAAAGIAFEIVPGLTTAVSAPALSVIPVTQRGLASGFAVVA